MSNVSAEFKKMFAFIAFGLKNKADMKNPEDYKYGFLLRQGINMFAVLAMKYSGKMTRELSDLLASITETKMICNMFTRPVKEWFEGWQDNVIAEIKNCDFYEVGALVIVNKHRKTYTLTAECYDYLNASEEDLTAIDEKSVYERMKGLSQDNYVYVRKFIIKNKLLTSVDRKNFMLEHGNDDEVRDIIELAYEKTPEGMYVCPNCGWTLEFVGEQPVCCHSACADVAMIKLADLKAVDAKFEYRLKKGVARYISYPGFAELEIDELCKKLGLNSQLWPDHDKYDIGITFDDGSYWGVDAKTYKNPKFLGSKIANDNIFQTVEVERGFYVIPDNVAKKVPKYIQICNSFLKNNKFTCVTMSKFKRILQDKVKHERS